MRANIYVNLMENKKSARKVTDFFLFLYFIATFNHFVQFPSLPV